MSELSLLAWLAGGKEQQGMSMPLDRAISDEQAWKSFLQVNCDSMFQMALLLSADTHVADAALAGSIGEMDLSKPPEKHSLAIWERAVMTMARIYASVWPLAGYRDRTLSAHLLRFTRVAWLCGRLLRTDPWHRGERNTNAAAKGTHPTLQHHNGRLKKSTGL